MRQLSAIVVSILFFISGCSTKDDCGAYVKDNCQVSEENFKKIKVGMTTESVMKILGAPNSIQPSYANDLHQEHYLWYRYSYLDRAPDVNLSYITVNFVNDSVVEMKVDLK
jgi:outer membrane protein assembly factor BamE (lipoprotein component of BamABCDE complex)